MSAASRSHPSLPIAVTPRPLALPRTHPTIRVIAASWRSLTGGKPVKDPARRTLIACSGGADSAALAIALASAAGRRAPDTLVIAHVVHDLRPRAEALPDRDSAKALAAALDIPFVEAAVEVRARAGNAEANARRLRYQALKNLAVEHGCAFVAAAHHADDQLETLIMRLLRGTGPRGLRGVHAMRRLSSRIQLIRPMLSITRAQAQSLCADAAWSWREDATNADTSRLRSAVRHTILPTLETLSPRASLRAARAARQLAQLDDLLTAAARALLDAAHADAAHPNDFATRTWQRGTLRAQPEIVLGELLRLTHRTLLPVGLDALSERTIAQAVKAIRSPSGEPKQLNLAGLSLELSATSVHVRTAAPRSRTL